MFRYFGNKKQLFSSFHSFLFFTKNVGTMVSAYPFRRMYDYLESAIQTDPQKTMHFSKNYVHLGGFLPVIRLSLTPKTKPCTIYRHEIIYSQFMMSSLQSSVKVCFIGMAFLSEILLFPATSMKNGNFSFWKR